MFKWIVHDYIKKGKKAMKYLQDTRFIYVYKMLVAEMWKSIKVNKTEQKEQIPPIVCS